MFKCYCGKEYQDKRILAIHIMRKKDNLSKLEKEKTLVNLVYGKEKVEEAIARYINKEVCILDLEKEGLEIRKYFKLLGIKRSSKEERATDRYKNNYKKVIFDKYGVDNISKLAECKKKKSETVMKNYGVKHNFLIEETKEKAIESYQKKTSTSEYKEEWLEKYKNTCKEKYGVDNVAKNKEVRKKNSNSQKKRCANMTLEERRKMTEAARSFWNKENSWVSKVELRVKSILDKLKIKYKPNETLFNYNYDIVIDNIIIEINGDFWHGNPNKYKSGDKLFETLIVDEVWEKDRLKKEVAEKNGKIVYVMWEEEINNCTDQELEEILKKWI